MQTSILLRTTVVALLLTGSEFALADTPDPSNFLVSSAGGELLVTPAGNGPTLAEIGATVTVTLIDPTGAPMVGFPAQDVWLDGAGSGEIALCGFGSTADQASLPNGELTISRALAAGGSTQTGMRVYVSGVVLETTLPIFVVSPDLDANLTVDLADLGLFAAEYSGSGPRADFDFDGTVGLADLGLFALGFGETCP